MSITVHDLLFYVDALSISKLDRRIAVEFQNRNEIFHPGLVKIRLFRNSCRTSQIISIGVVEMTREKGNIHQVPLHEEPDST